MFLCFRGLALIYFVSSLLVSYAAAQEDTRCELVAMDRETALELDAQLKGQFKVVAMLLGSYQVQQSERIHEAVNERAWSMRDAKLLVYSPKSETPLSAIVRERLAAQGVQVVAWTPGPLSNPASPNALLQKVLAILLR